MKKMFVLTALFLSSLFLIVGCEEDKEVAKPAPYLDFSATPGTSVPGSSPVVFKIDFKNIVSLIFSDGVSNEKIILLSSSSSVLKEKIVEKTTKYTVSVVGENGQPIEKSITVTTYIVDPPKSSLSIATDEDSLLTLNKAHVTIVAENMTNVLLNGQPVTSNTFDVNAPLDTIPLKFKITGIGSKGEVLKDSIFISTDFRSSWLEQSFWTTDSVQWKNNSGVWEHYNNYPQKLMADTMYFLGDNFVVKNCGDTYTYKWFWENNQTIINIVGSRTLVFSLTQDKMIFMDLIDEDLKIYYSGHLMNF